MYKLFIEAFVVGIMILVVGSIVGYCIGKLYSVDLPKECKSWNKNHIMELSLFSTGFILHLVCEFTGINKYYIKNSYASRY